MGGYRPIICVDFDGVLHSYSSGWKGPGNIPDPPVDGAMDWLRDLWLADRCTVAIFSSRSKSLRGRRAMKRWLRHHLHLRERFSDSPGPQYMDPVRKQVADDIFDAITWPWFKPPALVTLDDRALTFEGEWPALDDMLAFKPWNKR